MRIVKFIQTVNRYLFVLGAVPLFIATILTVIDVSGRYFRLPLPGTLEISTLCLALSVALTLAHTQALKGNTDVDVLYNLFLPKPKGYQCLYVILLRDHCRAHGLASMAMGGVFSSHSGMGRYCRLALLAV